MKKIMIGLVSMSVLIFSESQGMRVEQKGLQRGHSRIVQPRRDSPIIRAEQTVDLSQHKIEDFIESDGSGGYKLREEVSDEAVIQYLTVAWEGMRADQREHVLSMILMSSDSRSVERYATSLTFKACVKKFLRANDQTIIPALSTMFKK